MTQKNKPEIGSITWFDLTTKDAKSLKDFYSEVVGWKSEPVSMGDYDDYSMVAPESGKVASGICHARGVNENLPPQWLIYITVENVDKSAKKCEELGGKVLVKPKNLGNYGRYCVVEDPSGAVCALFKPE